MAAVPAGKRAENLDILDRVVVAVAQRQRDQGSRPGRPAARTATKSSVLGRGQPRAGTGSAGPPPDWTRPPPARFRWSAIAPVRLWQRRPASGSSSAVSPPGLDSSTHAPSPTTRTASTPTKRNVKVLAGAVPARPEKSRKPGDSSKPGKPHESRQPGWSGQFDTMQPTVHRHAIDRWRNGCCLLRRTAAERCGRFQLRRVSINLQTADMVPFKCVNIGICIIAVG